MYCRTAALLLACGACVAVPAFSQTATNPTQLPSATTQGDVPVFRMTVVGRTLPSINYRPRRGDTRINFAGTALLPKANGWASVTGEKGYIKIDARFDNLEPPQRYGVEYLTYVLWAITPEGRDEIGTDAKTRHDFSHCRSWMIAGNLLPVTSGDRASEDEAVGLKNLIGQRSKFGRQASRNRLARRDPDFTHVQPKSVQGVIKGDFQQGLQAGTRLRSGGDDGAECTLMGGAPLNLFFSLLAPSDVKNEALAEQPLAAFAGHHHRLVAHPDRAPITG